MATLEFIEKRIKSFETQIEKAKATIERHQKTIEKNKIALENESDESKFWWYESNINYTKNSIRSQTKKMIDLNEKLQKLYAEKQKFNSKRDNPVLVQFLNAWKARVEEFYHEQYKALIANDTEELYKEYSKSTTEIERRYYKGEISYSDCKRELRMNLSKFYGKYIDALKYCKSKRKPVFDEEKFQSELRADWNAKYDMIISRVTEIVGEIKEANLYIGLNGELNGVVKGESKRCKVETIGAGGYNIQCFHFRVLVHELK